MSTEWIPLPVPAEDYEEFKHMVEYRQTQRGKAPAPSAEELSSGDLAVAGVVRAAFDDFQNWPMEALTRLAKASTITTLRFSEVMDLCAVEPGSLHSTEEIAETLDMSVAQWRAACRKMRPHLEKHYPEVPRHESGSHAGEPYWPLVDIAGRSLKVRDQLYVGITDEQARRWKRVRAGN